jgi:hypothetical protein
MGHPPVEVWKYTPKQMSAFLFIAAKRQRREQKELLALQALAARGEPKELRKILKDD